MEQELFTWVNWDLLEAGVFQFEEVTLKTKIYIFTAGSKFDYAVIDTIKGYLILGRSKIEYKFKLHFKVGVKV